MSCATAATPVRGSTGAERPVVIIDGADASGIAALLNSTSLASAAASRCSDELRADVVVVIVGGGPGGADEAVASLRRLPPSMRAGRTVAVAAPGPQSLGLVDEVRRLAPVIFEDREDEEGRKRLVERLLRFVDVALRPSNPFAPGADRFRRSR